ncbi:MAG: fasciclin domain-containing protein [Hyphomonadaceae bacterium]
MKPQTLRRVSYRMTIPRTLRAALLAAACLLAPQGAIAQNGGRFLVAETETPNPQGDVLDVAAATGQFTQFLAAVEAAGYEETLRGEGPFTLFAPTDAAFRQMRRSEIDRLMRPENRDELLALLAYHVVPERVTSANVRGRVTRPESSNGYQVTLDGRDGLRINDQLVALPDIEASNGVIQGINVVLSPPVLVADAGASLGR